MATTTAARMSIGARMYSAVDHIATALFGFEGAASAAATGLHLLGILVVGFSTALVGGIIRDILLGDTPPAAFRSASRIFMALAGSLVAFGVYAQISDVPSWVLVVPDAAALALFAVTGAEKAAAYGSNIWVVVMLGTITGTGGGMLRDLLLNRLPVALTGQVYASAAAAGAVVVGVALKLKIPPTLAMILGFVVCLAIRLLAVEFDWRLPSVR